MEPRRECLNQIANTRGGGSRAGEIRGVLRQQADADKVARNRLQQRKALHKPEWRRNRGWSRPGFILGNGRRNNQPVRHPLESLSEHSRQPASALYCAERSQPNPPCTQQRRRKKAASSHGVLDGEVDSHAADG